MSSSSGRSASVAAGDFQVVPVADRAPAALPPRPRSSSSSAIVEYTPPADNPEDEDLEVKLRRILECVPVRVSNTSGSSAGSGSGDFHQIIKAAADDDDGIQKTVIPSRPPSIIPPPVFKAGDGKQKTVMTSRPPSNTPPYLQLSQTTPFSFRSQPFIPIPFSLLPQTPALTGVAPVSSSNITFPSPFLNSSSRKPTASISSIAPVSSSKMTFPSPFVNCTFPRPTASVSSIPPNQPRPYPSPSRPPGSLRRPWPRPIPLLRPELAGLFHLSAEGRLVRSTPLHKSQPPTETPLGPIGASFVNSTASGKQSAVSSVTDPGLPPGAAGNDKPVTDVSTEVGAPVIEQSDAWTAYKTERGNDKPVSDVSIKVGTPAVDESDAWTAYKTERGPVFYYNAVTGKSTSEKPVGYEGELSMSVQECYACLVRRLPESTTTEQVREIFSQFGRVLDAMVFMNNFTDVSMGLAYVIFETRTARSAAMGCTGTFLGGDMIYVSDAQKGIGLNAYEFGDGHFNNCITIGECRKRQPTEWPDCGGSRRREDNTDAGSNLERSPKRLCGD